MDINVLESELRNLGYDREDYIASEIGNRAVISDDFTGKLLNHTVFDNCSFEGANYDFAAVTGSIYRRCKFINCSMNQPDFQFCDFYECEFISEGTVVSSFNNCNFVRSRFVGINFESCTFTGALFEDCELRNVSIKNSTLENALFSKCLFIDMELRDLNMDYVHIEDPKMSNVVLPFAQIPYMFGCLRYIMDTSDSVRVSSTEGGDISVQEYVEKAIPTLVQYWTIKSKNQPEFYFPLANVYIATGNRVNAFESLKMGLVTTAATRDFRMIKFYCKLISESNLYNPDALQKFYNLINRFGIDVDTNSLEMRSFMRNIGEIKETLFSSDKKPMLKFLFKTNTTINDSESIGKVLGRLFSMAKMKGSLMPNNVELVLSENSPLMISLQVSGEEKNIITLLPILLTLANVTSNEIKRFIPLFTETTSDAKFLIDEQDVTMQVRKLADDCTSCGIMLSLAEYHLTNCASANMLGIMPYFFDCWNTSEAGDFKTLLLPN